MTFSAGSAGGATPPLDVARVMGCAVRAARLEPGVFAEVARDSSLTLGAVAVPAAVSFAAGVGALLFEKVLFDAGGLVAIVLRQLLLGPLAGVGAWFAWVMISHRVLASSGVAVNRDSLLRALGFATVPVALLLLMFVPDLLQGPALRLGYLSGGVVAATSVLTPLWALVAIQEAAPTATPRQVTFATLAGYLAALAVLGWLGFVAGIAPGFTVFLSGDRFL